MRWTRNRPRITVIEWQKKWTKKFTSYAAQDIKRINNLQKSLIEIIKYGSKRTI